MNARNNADLISPLQALIFAAAVSLALILVLVPFLPG